MRYVICDDFEDHRSWSDAWGLYEHIFSDESDAKSRQVRTRHKPLLLVAYSVDNAPIAFKMGYELKGHRFYSWLGGVANDHRGKGVGRELMKLQHEELVRRGYSEVETKTKNSWKDMLILNLKSGFDLVGIYTDHVGEPKIILRKTLTVL